ncbi:MAG: hypothetical protein ABI520_03755 [Caldimonas sp.]
MSDEQDSWFKSAFGLDLGKAAAAVKDEASAMVDDAKTKVGQIVQGAKEAVEGGIDGVASGIAGAAAKAAGAVGGAAAGVAKKAAEAVGAVGGSGTGSFPLHGSVGRGGQNASADVRAVQGALGIAADGACGAQTIGAIEAFQRKMGVAKPDGRVDAGGATERALRGGATPPAPSTAPAPAAAEPASPLDRLTKGAAGVVDRVTKAGGEAVERAGELVEEVVPGSKGLAGKVAETIGEGVGAAKGLANQVVEGTKKALSDPKALVEQSAADGGPPPDAGPADGGAPDAGTQPDPIFEDFDKPFNVRADDPVEFVNKGNEYLGQGIAGHMTTDTLTIAHADTDGKGRVVRANLRVRTTTARPRWIAGRTIGDEKLVIEQAQELIRQHEERHREIMKGAMIKAVAEMRGKSTDEADKILAKWISRVDSDQDALDTREGKIEIIQSGGRMTGARLVPR